MWTFVIFVFFGIVLSRVESQNGRGAQHEHHGHGWDIRLAVPGEPGSDYPTLGAIPRTSFSCAGKDPGYYADLETDCQVFRVCTVGSTYGFQSFLCPNGTLFNQAVFVCDWWMNVRCDKSQQLFQSTGEKFGNLRLGPQLMKDIKKMLTYPMRTPYAKSEMKSNLIIMQEYKPPFGQLFPNGALLATPDRTPNNVYVPAKQIQSVTQNSYSGNDIAFAASTPNPRYLSAEFNTVQRDIQDGVETFQRQRQNGQYIQQNRFIQNSQLQKSKNAISNGHTGRIIQPANALLSNNIENLQVTRPTQNYNQFNTQFGQKQRNNFAATFNMNSAINSHTGQLNGQNSQYINSKKLSQLNSEKQLELGVGLSRQQYNYRSNQEKQPYVYNTPPTRLSNEIGQIQAKQNLVSTTTSGIAPTIIAKTLTLSRLVEDPKPGKPKSRITVKTWIVKPSKTAKLISPTPYTYDRPAPTERLTDSTPYVYNTPAALPQPARYVAGTNQPYVYNRPTAAKQVITTTQVPSQPYPSPTTPLPTLPSRLYLTPSPSSTKASRLYLVPTTFKPAARIYLPPSEEETAVPMVPARQYLAPNQIQQPTYKPSEQLRASPTSPTPTYTVSSTTPSINTNSPSFTLTKQSHINTNHNNLTFSDILTKEKLDITVNDIVEHTSNFLNTASPAQFGQLRQDVDSLDYSENSGFYLPPEATTDSGEILTSQTPSVASKSSRLIAPSINLEPPEETYNNNQITNQLSNLPFFKEPASLANTIERTVSLKISIPEKIASYLFNRRNETDFERLEILNTGSSNYLVLTNNPFNKNSKNNFIPIGRLIQDKNSSISNSQALVFSLLADSINVAKEYSNLAKQDITSPIPVQSPLQNMNDEEITRISDRISQLTSSQYGNNFNNINSAKIISTEQTTSDTPNQYTNTAEKKVIQNQIERVQSQRTTHKPSEQTNLIQFSARFQSGDTGDLNSTLLNSNQNKIYSGQFYQYPVPDVTSQIYNRQSSGNLIQMNSIRSQNKILDSNNLVNENNLVTPTSAHVEIVQSQTAPLPPARLQLPPTPSNELESFNNQESLNELLRSGNGISALLEDKIVGKISHPLENNKLVSYQKDQYVYTKLDDTVVQNFQNNAVQSNRANGQIIQPNPKLIQNPNIPNIVALQFIPSVSYQLEDEKEQQKILNAFQIDEFGTPRQRSGQIQGTNQRQEILTSDINYTVDHSPSKEVNGLNTLYNGPSSYSAPQSSVGNLGKQINNFNSRLELDEDNGYPRVTPARQFTF